MNNEIINEAGKRYGRLQVIEQSSNWYHQPKDKRGIVRRKALWTVQCDCGEVFDTLGCSLRNGHATSCQHCRRAETFRDITRNGEVLVRGERGRISSWQ
jgi:hypothetical protein